MGRTHCSLTIRRKLRFPRTLAFLLLFQLILLVVLGFGGPVIAVYYKLQRKQCEQSNSIPCIPERVYSLGRVKLFEVMARWKLEGNVLRDDSWLTVWTPLLWKQARWASGATTRKECGSSLALPKELVIAMLQDWRFTSSVYYKD